MAVPLVEISGLSVDFTGGGRLSRAVDSIDLAIAPGEALGLVGESGSGKSVTWLAALGLLPARALVTGSVTLEGAVAGGGVGPSLIGAPDYTNTSTRISAAWTFAAGALPMTFAGSGTISSAAGDVPNVFAGP